MSLRSASERARTTVKKDRRAGFSYVAVLVLTAMLSSMALTYVNRVGIAANSTTEHMNQVKAEYYARAAVHHSVWALRNSGFFPVAEDRYFMKDFEDGRYGYKVKRHTDYEFGTVAAIGICGETVAEVSYVVFLPDWDDWDPWDD